MGRISNSFALFLALGRIINMVVLFFMPLLLVRFLSQHDYGIFSQFFTIFTVASEILAFGFQSSIYYFYPNLCDQDKRKLLSNTFVTFIFIGGLFALIAFFSPLNNCLFAESELGNYMTWIILTISFSVPTNIISPLNTVREDKVGALLTQACISLLRIIVIILSALITHDLSIIFAGLAIYQILLFVFTSWYSFHGINFTISPTIFKQQLAYSLPFGIGVSLQLFSNYYDKFVCIKFLSPIQYAIYGIAFLSIPGISQIYDSICQVNVVNMSISHQNGCDEEVLPQFKNFITRVFSFSAPVIIAFSIFAEEVIVFLFTDDYASAAPYFRIYSLSFLTSVLGAGTIIRSLGKTSFSMYVFLFTCIIGLPLTYYLIKTKGIDGAILGAMFNMIFPRILQLCLEAYSIKVRISNFLPWKSLLFVLSVSLLGSVPLILTKIKFHMNIWICIGESIVYLLIVYSFFIRKDIFIMRKDQIIEYYRRIIRCKRQK